MIILQKTCNQSVVDSFEPVDETDLRFFSRDNNSMGVLRFSMHDSVRSMFVKEDKSVNVA
jgi:hypothetical protein